MSNEADEFEKYIVLQITMQLKEIMADAKNILKRNVENEVYNSYSPVQYNRTNDLLSSIENVFTLSEGIIYFNSSAIGHTDNMYNPVGDYTPKWIDMGHKDSTGIDNMYHNYPARNFIQLTIDELEEKYGKDCVIRLDN